MEVTFSNRFPLSDSRAFFGKEECLEVVARFESKGVESADKRSCLIYCASVMLQEEAFSSLSSFFHLVGVGFLVCQFVCKVIYLLFCQSGDSLCFLFQKEDISLLFRCVATADATFDTSESNVLGMGNAHFVFQNEIFGLEVK